MKRFCFSASTAVLFFLFSSGAFAQQLFDSWINYKVPKNPSAVFSVDIDLDGDLDLITSHQQVDATGRYPVVIFKNNGVGFFQRDTALHTLGSPVMVTARDLDQDGDIEIVTCNSGNKVSIFKNRGGTRGFELPLDCPVGARPETVVLDLINDDTTLDILTANFQDGTASILINHGAASFPSETTKVLGIQPRSIAAFDLDNDGDKDFASSLQIFVDRTTRTYEGINGFVVTENKGNGRFDDSARVFFKVPLGLDTSRTDTIHTPVRLIAADFNGDGFSDFALACSSSISPARTNLFVYMNIPSRGGVYRSTNSGASWTRTVAGMTNNEPRALAVKSSGELFAGTAGGGVYHSTDNGLSWTAFNSGLTNTTVMALAFNSGGRAFAGSLGGGVFRSADNGADWETASSGITNPNVRALAVSPLGHLFAGSAGGVFRSTNNAASWEKRNTGLSDTGVTALAIPSGGTGTLIFAGTPSGVFRSLDNGQHWALSNNGLSNTNVTVLAAKNGGPLFAGTAGSGVFRSADSGATWTAVNTGLTNMQIRAFALHSSGDIYAGTASGGVFRSTNNGDSWTAVNGGLLNTKVLSLAVGSGGEVFAGTNGSLSSSNFGVPVRKQLGVLCFSIFAGDLDNDGDVDLVVPNIGTALIPGTVSVLKNNGSGAFADRVDYFSPSAPYWVDGGDYDRDGDIDLAVVSRTGASMAILRNKGNGIFETGLEFSTGNGNEPFGIASADLEPDGDNDVVVGNLGFANVVTIHRNNGSGVFPDTATDYNYLNFLGNPRKVAIADLDGDLDLDLATANTSIAGQADASISVVFNVGNGNFPDTSVVNYPLVIGSGPQSIVAEDLDGDGDNDLATPNLGSNTIAVLKNNGNATYAVPQYYPAGSQPKDITAADFDRDGDNDLAVVNFGLSDVPDSISVFPNDGFGAFPGRTDYLVGSFPTGLDAADFNGDLYPDIAVTAAGGGAVADTAVVVFINDATGNFFTGVRYLPAPGPAAVLVAADMNGDGHLDIVTADSVVNTVSVFFNNGDGTFAPSTEYGCGLKPRGLAPADFDGDGDLDLAVSNFRMVNPPVANQTYGAFTILTNLSTSPCYAKGDLNGDLLINLADIVQEQNCAFLGIGLCQLCTADVNCDGKLTLVDVVFLLRRVYSGIPFPCS